MRQETPDYSASLAADKEDHYPVKQRRRPRRLNPNWAGIAWLEAKSLPATRIVAKHPAERGGSDLYTLIAAGRSMAAMHGCPRPMFQLFETTVSSALLRRSVGAACPDCDDWSRTARCPEHPADHYSRAAWLGYGEELMSTLTPAADTLGPAADTLIPERQLQEITHLSAYARGTGQLAWSVTS